MANTYVLIASNTLTSSAASVTFSSIPGTYTDLVLKWSSRSTNAGTNSSSLMIRTNITGQNYSNIRISGSGSAATSAKDSNQGSIIAQESQPSAGNTSNTFANGEMYIPQYTGSNNIQTGSFSAGENNATAAYIQATAGLVRTNGTAINEIVITDLMALIASGSSFFLYGIKNS